MLKGHLVLVACWMLCLNGIADESVFPDIGTGTKLARTLAGKTFDQGEEILRNGIAESDRLSPSDYGDYLFLSCVVYKVQKEFDKLHILLRTEDDRQSTNAVAADGKLKRAYISYTKALLEIADEHFREALSYCNEARTSLDGEAFPVDMEARLLSTIAKAQLGRGMVLDFRKTLKEGRMICEVELGLKSKPGKWDKRPGTEQAHDNLWNVYSLFAVLESQSYLMTRNAPGAASVLRSAAGVMEKAEGKSNVGLPRVFEKLAEVHFLFNEEKKGQQAIDRLIEALLAHQPMFRAPVKVIQNAAERAHRANDTKLAARRVAQMVGIYEHHKMPISGLVESTMLLSNMVDSGGWEKTRAFFDLVLAAIQTEYPANPEKKVPFLSEFAARSRFMQRPKDVVRYYQEIVSINAAKPGSADAISALSRQMRYLREIGWNADAAEISGQLVKAMQAKYGDDSRVGDAMLDHALALKSLKKDDEAVKFESEANRVYAKCFQAK